MKKNIFWSLLIAVMFMMPLRAECIPPLPAEIYGTVTVDGVQVTDGTGYKIQIKDLAGTLFVDAWGVPTEYDLVLYEGYYLIYLPIANADQPGGVTPGETAVFHLLYPNSPFSVISPNNGQFVVGGSESSELIDLVAITACTSDANCNDGNSCTEDTCDLATGECSNDALSDGTDCDDGDECTTADACSAGTCEGGAPPNCNDGNVCTTDSCDSALGCQNVNNTDSCDDGDECTTADTCSAGSCVGGAAPDCDDGNVCTDDSCDSAIGCVNSPVVNGASCDDINTCTENDECRDGVCDGDTLPDESSCDDDNTCTDPDKCNGGECVGTVLPNETECDDDNACTSIGTCTDGTCEGAAPIEDGGECDDGLFCYDGTTCTEGVCGNGQLNTCDDNNLCTDDSCDEDADVCVNDNNTVACDDGFFCTVNDGCADGACSGPERDCSDGVDCTVDSCDDGGDVCVNDVDHNYCDDDIGCTTDSCDPVNDCQYVAKDALCDDHTNQNCDICDPGAIAADANGCVMDIIGCFNINTPVGPGVDVPDPNSPVQGLNITVWFEEVATPGVTAVQDNSDPVDLLPNFTLCGNHFNVSTTAVYNGRIHICAPYNRNLVPSGENVSLIHFVNGQPTPALDQTVGVDQVCGFVNSLSPFAPAASAVCLDDDGDGFWGQANCGTAVDCDDTDAAINPGATEVCDGKDNNCDGSVDEGGVCPDSSPTQAADGGTGGCSVTTVSHNISSGSAMANTLVLLLPLFIFGIKRRKYGKDNKDKSCK